MYDVNEELKAELHKLGWVYPWIYDHTKRYIFAKLNRTGELIAVEDDKIWQEDIKKLSQPNFNRILARTLLHA